MGSIEWIYANFQFNANLLKTSLKIELLTKVEVLHIKKSKYFFSQNDIFEGDVYLLMLNRSTLNKTSVLSRRLREVNIKTSSLSK